MTILLWGEEKKEGGTSPFIEALIEAVADKAPMIEAVKQREKWSKKKGYVPRSLQGCLDHGYHQGGPFQGHEGEHPQSCGHLLATCR